MKKILILNTLIAALLFFNNANAQLSGVLNKAKDKAKQIGKPKDNSANTPAADTTATQVEEPAQQTQEQTQQTQEQTQQTPPAAPPSVKAYQNYDFRAGDKIIFEDNFATDQDGEFPAHWDLLNGQGVVNKIAGIPAFLLTDGNYGRIKPYMKTDSYLTDNFSIEFDYYMGHDAYGIKLFLYDKDGGEADIAFNADGIEYNATDKNLTGSLPTEMQYDNFFDRWHHVSIAYKADQLKVYMDQYRTLTVPHCNFAPSRFECGGIGSVESPIIFTNLKIADGASMNMLDKLLTDGKFVTHGIHFDVNKATLKPESMGVISDMVKFMQAHPDLKLEIDGHTDNDGDDASNMKLSQARAESVKTAMAAAGIDAARLTTKGFGESKPIGTNDTPEGKGMNRRVEFVKM